MCLMRRPQSKNGARVKYSAWSTTKSQNTIRRLFKGGRIRIQTLLCRCTAEIFEHGAISSILRNGLEDITSMACGERQETCYTSFPKAPAAIQPS